MVKITSRDGTVITYDKKGSGPILLLVLGALNKRSQGKKLAELLSDKFTVVSYDRRGRGDSTDVLPYSAKKEVEDIEALIDEHGGRAFVYGHSSGCILALIAADKLDNKIQRLALYELPYNSDQVGLEGAEKYRSHLATLLSHGDNDEAIATFVKSVGVTEKQIAAMKRLPMWKGLVAMAPTLEYDTIRLMELYPKIDFGNIQTESLTMYGSKSPQFMEDTARDIAEKMPHATVKPIEGQTHDVKPDVLAPILSKYFV